MLSINQIMLDQTDSALLLDEGWQFYKLKEGDSFNYKLIHEIKHWTSVSVPHDWDRDGPWLKTHKSGTSGGYAPCGRGIYKRICKIPNFSNELRYFLYFDGVYMNSSYYINGKKLYKQFFGYTPFWFEITDYLHGSEQFELVVLVDHSKMPSCRWYSGSGIYRNVYLINQPKVAFKLGSLFIRSVFENNKFKELLFSIEIERKNNSSLNSDLEITLEYEILDSKADSIQNDEIIVPINKVFGVHEFRVNLANPKLWTPDESNLYTINVNLKSKQLNIKATATRTFGIRQIQFSGNGFYLNGSNIKLKGVNLHHDAGCVGAAVPIDVWKRRILKLKEMGCNAIRTSHNPPSQEFLDICDELGILILAEAFDKKDGIWRSLFKMRLNSKFRQEWLKNLENFIIRDRNHPSIILWSLGNEIKMLHTASKKKFFVKLKEFVLKLDDTRPITVVLMPPTLFKELKTRKKPLYEDIVDVICTNYTEVYLPEFHQLKPDKASISTEAYHYWRMRSKTESLAEFPPKPNHPNTTAHHPWLYIKDFPYICGVFLWTGIEYLGEVRDPYPYHGRTNAPISINGFLKPEAYFLQTIWRNEPTVRIAVLDEKANIPLGKFNFDFPKVVRHWNFQGREGELFTIFTYTNCDRVKLRINGKDIGEQQADKIKNQTKWEIPYSAGIIEAIGINEKSKEDSNSSGEKGMAYDSLKTSKGTDKLLLKPDRTEMKANGIECMNLEIFAVDPDSQINVWDTQRIEIKIKGPIELIGLDNGNLADHTPYSSKSTQLFNGTALAIFRAKKIPGLAQITVVTEKSTTRIKINIKAILDYFKF